jgi:hypothetical protein
MSKTQAQRDAVMAWLVADLDANADKVTVLFDHHPAYTAGNHHGESRFLQCGNRPRQGVPRRRDR